MSRLLGLPNYRMVIVDSEGYEVPQNDCAEWTLMDEAQDGTAHLQVAAVKGQAHHVTSISASFDQPVIGRLALRDGPFEQASWFVHGSLHLPYARPLRCTMDAPLEVTLSLPDGLAPGICLSLVLSGYTR